MASYADIFKRKEMKYVISAQQREIVEDQCSDMMEVDTYGRTRVTSLYYDTPEWLLIERSLDKPLYKEKLRVRWYGEGNADGFPEPTTQVFIELKKKFKGIVYKRRLSCSFAAAQAFLEGEGYLSVLNAYPLPDAVVQESAYAPRSLQIASEIEAFMKRFGNLRPSMLITCERTALTPRLSEGETHDTSVQDDVRITFDENIAYRNLLGNSDSWCAITQPGHAVMEIKVAGPYPQWLLTAVSCAQARPSSFSKYGKAYTAVQTKARACVANEQRYSQELPLLVTVGSAAPVSSSAAWKTSRQRPFRVKAAVENKTPLQSLKTWVQTAVIKKEKHYV